MPGLSIRSRTKTPGLASSDAPLRMLATPPEAIRIAMWSVPCPDAAILLRAFAARADTAVLDAPFSAAFLRASQGHPASPAEGPSDLPDDWREVVDRVLGPVPDERPIWYQSHPTLHLLPEFGRDWIDQMTSAFLLLSPQQALEVLGPGAVPLTADGLGFRTQWEIFEAVADRLGAAPPVLDADDLRANPVGALTRLCEALELPFRRDMLQAIGAWDASQTGASPQRAVPGPDDPLAVIAGLTRSSHDISLTDHPGHMAALAEGAYPYYERLRAHRLV